MVATLSLLTSCVLRLSLFPSLVGRPISRKPVGDRPVSSRPVNHGPVRGNRSKQHGGGGTTRRPPAASIGCLPITGNRMTQRLGGRRFIQRDRAEGRVSSDGSQGKGFNHPNPGEDRCEPLQSREPMCRHGLTGAGRALFAREGTPLSHRPAPPPPGCPQVENPHGPEEEACAGNSRAIANDRRTGPS